VQGGKGQGGKVVLSLQCEETDKAEEGERQVQGTEMVLLQTEE
jgi:hypothetical protein